VSSSSFQEIILVRKRSLLTREQDKNQVKIAISTNQLARPLHQATADVSIQFTQKNSSLFTPSYIHTCKDSPKLYYTIVLSLAAYIHCILCLPS